MISTHIQMVMLVSKISFLLTTFNKVKEKNMLSRIQLHELVFSSNVPHSLKTITNYGSL